MDESSSQSCDQLSQSLPTVEALDLNNNNGNHGDVVSDKQPPITAVNKLTVHAGDDKSRISVVGKSTAVSSYNVVNSKLVRLDRNGKDVTLPGNQETPGAVNEAQKLPHKVSLPYVDDGVDSSRSHHQDGGKHCAPSKRPSRKMSQQQQDKNANNPIRVTRSTSKMMAAQVTTGNSKAPNKLDDDRCVDSLSADDVKDSTNHGQIKYNKSRGFPATAKATNLTRSEMNSIFTNNGIKCDGHHCTTVNGDVNKGSHIVDHILNDSLLPLQDVTNSSSNGDTTGTAVAKSQAQTRVYDLVAGKKSKKGKRQQLRKTAQVPHKKKPNTTERNETSTSTTEEEHLVFTNDDKSVAHVKDTIRLSHSQASGHSRNSRELVREY